jgi:triphosphatase
MCPRIASHILGRTVYPIRHNGTEIEIHRPRKGRGRREIFRLYEIELELKAGEANELFEVEAKELFEVARTLAAAAPFQAASKSKSERGYELLAKKLSSRQGRTIALSPKADWATAFRTVARACLYQGDFPDARKHVLPRS